jgi:hypothetical protein
MALAVSLITSLGQLPTQQLTRYLVTYLTDQLFQLNQRPSPSKTLLFLFRKLVNYPRYPTF